MTTTVAQPEAPISAWGQIIDGQRQYHPHTGQTEVLLSEARFTAAVAGTGGGKTCIGPLWVIQQIYRTVDSRELKHAPVVGFIVAPTYPILARATAPSFVEALRGTNLEGRYVESRNRYYLPRGLGTVWLLSADRPMGLEGGQADFAWIDEGGQLRYDAWVAIQGRLGMRMAPALITTTPYGQNWLFHRFYKRAMGGDVDYRVVTWASNRNPAYPDEEYERAKRTLSPTRFAARYEGRFVRPAGLVYPDLPSCVCDFDALPDGLDYGGIDWGWNDPFSALVGRLDDDNVLWLWYERYRSEVSMRNHAAALPRQAVYYAGHDRPEHMQELRASGHSVSRNRLKSIALGVEAVRARIYHSTLKIHPRCRALLAEAADYRYPEKDDEIQGDTPLDGFDHALDALRYLIGSIDRRRVAGTIEPVGSDNGRERKPRARYG